MTKMKLIKTTVSETTVRMRFADQSDAAEATQWVDFQVPLGDLRSPKGQEELGDPETRYLAEIRLVALRFVRDAIDAETRRLAGLANRIA
jgi:hypothetical protein